MTSAYFVFVPIGETNELPVGAAIISSCNPAFCEMLELSWAAPDGSQFAELVCTAVERWHNGAVVALSSARLALVACYEPSRGTILPYGPAAEALLARWCGTMAQDELVVDWSLFEQVGVNALSVGVTQ